jgi:hypothetical protein
MKREINVTPWKHITIKKSLDTFKPSTFNKIKKFFNID